ncbi:hypothetical protein FVEN_g3937 [Fusarium venenatum]|uniref:Aminoglycoside phosphotransferase domain-containing protein n=1 Tax=Fusarium venenatum TaxID=56646 RepID=A0A2L2U1S8_9HYPO|nr:uncharacterized protein FVRRES_09397 [Fusarium venenatum]KAG8358387.1 hypothetical protein FVEN_g3937 [Fusarium venenatum]KAH6966078.1 hypothetical protein EDB82DRAFT_541195 [Fusarium venenatum]CEI69320.1 unnamed protein product [Fusarium venenatum]
MAYLDAHRIHDLVKEVSEDSWIVNDEALITRHHSQPQQPYWEGDQGSFFTMSEAPIPKPPTQRISDDCPITDVVKMSDEHWGLFKIGQAHLKVTYNNGAQEHNTLKALAKASFDFMVPTEYCHAVYGNHYYIVHTILPGKSIAEVWHKTDDEELQMKWARQIAEAYDQLSKWNNGRICGIDGGNLTHYYSAKDDWENPSMFTPEVIQRNYEEIGLDCSEFVFAHNHAMPIAFMIDETKGLVGISTWGSAGFVPRDWVRTMTRTNLYLESMPTCDNNNWTIRDKRLWEWKMEVALAEKGFREFWFAHGAWRLDDNDPLKAEVLKKLEGRR